jgi:hypothetical protein
MEWSEIRYVLPGVLDTLSMAWALCWLINRFAAGSVHQTIADEIEPNLSLRNMGLTADELALLDWSNPDRYECARWM